MKIKIFKMLLLLLPFYLFADKDIRDSVSILPGNSGGGQLYVDSAVHLNHTPLIENPDSLLSFDTTTKQVKACKYPDTVTYSDTSTVSRMIIHGVDSGTVPQAITDSTFGNTPITIAGDTVKVSFTGTPGDTFTHSGVSGPSASSFYSGCSAPNGDCYFGVGGSLSDNGWYIQTSGTGALTKVTGTAYGKSPVGMACDLDTNIYGAIYDGYIYKRTSGAGSFDTIPGTVKLWSGLTCDDYGLLYGVTYGDTIYTSSDEGATWDFFQKITDVRDVARDYIGGVYALDGVTTGDIYYKASEAASFVSIGNNGRWYNIGCCLNGNVYVGTSVADGTYIRIGGVGPFVKLQNNNAFASFFGKMDSTACALISNGVWIRTADPTNTVFDVYGGNVSFHGKLTVDNTPTTTTAEYMIVKNEWPDEQLYKKPIDSLRAESAVDSGRIPMSLGSNERTESSITDTGDYCHIRKGLFVDDNIGIGTGTPGAMLHLFADQKPSEIRFTQYTDDNSGNRIRMQKSRGSESVPAIVQSSDNLGGIVFQGYDGDQFINTAYILADVDGTPGDDDMPGRIEFYTTADDAASGTERMVIKSDGKIGIGILGPDELLDVNGNITANNIYPNTDDTYYVGKNDDDSPFAYKGVILKDQTDGKYYRLELNNGALDIVDLTD